MSSQDVASQYVPVMNCIFAAQKHVSLYIIAASLSFATGVGLFVCVCFSCRE